MVRDGEATSVAAQEALAGQLATLQQQKQEGENKHNAEIAALKKELEEAVLKAQSVAFPAVADIVRAVEQPSANANSQISSTIREYEALGGITQMYDRVVATEKDRQTECSKRKELGEYIYIYIFIYN